MDESEQDLMVDHIGEAVEAGPIPIGDLRDRLVAAGLMSDLPAGENRLDSILEMEALEELVEMIGGVGYEEESGLVYDSAQVVIGRYATHRMTGEELESGQLRLGLDMVLLTGHIDGSETFTLHGPGFREGVLAGNDHAFWNMPEPMKLLDAGTLVSFRFTSTTEIMVEWPVEVGDGSDEKISILGLIAEEGHDLDEMLGFELCLWVGYPLALGGAEFTKPQPPLTELMAELSYANDGEFYGLEDEEWVTPRMRARGIRIATIYMSHGLEQCCMTHLQKLAAAWWAHLDGEESPYTIDEIRKALNHGGYVLAADELIGNDAHRRERRASFLAPLAEGHRSNRAVAKLLLAIGIGYGDPLESERLLREVESLDPLIGEAKLEMGIISLDRGDARRTAYYFRQCGMPPESPLMKMVSGGDSPMPKVGRNDPCPCGSGKKSKKCHDGESTLGSGVRLIDRLIIYLSRSRPTVLAGLDLSFDDLGTFADELALFEGGAIEEYLADRGDLLTEPDAAELRLWVSSKRSVLEVTSVIPGAGIGLLDLISGRRVVVAEASASEKVEVGDVVMVVVVESPASVIAGNVLIIPPAHREVAIQIIADGGDLWSLAQWWSGVLAPPVVTNREGHAMELFEAWIDVPGPESELREWLDRTLVETTGGWHRLIEIEEEMVVEATFRIDDDEDPYATDDEPTNFLVVEVNSTERVDRMVDLVQESFPDAILVEVDYLDDDFLD